MGEGWRNKDKPVLWIRIGFNADPDPAIMRIRIQIQIQEAKPKRI
jgi:hypothetical protein